MNKDFASGNNESRQVGSQAWKAEFGRHRLRTPWRGGIELALFHLQRSFRTDDDPDGFGVPFSPDSGFEWERDRGTQPHSLYEDRWNELREKVELRTRRATEQAIRYAKRANSYMRATNWDTVEHDVRDAIEKTMSELGEALAKIRSELSKRQTESEPVTKSEQKSRIQRVPIEFDKVKDPFVEDSFTNSSGIPSSTPISRAERDANRRIILEELRSDMISLEEAERRLNELG